VLYSGFLASATALLASFVRNLRRGHSWRTAVPAGYGLSLIGLLIFAGGGVGDAFWHELFGIETGVEGALSATHQLLDLGTVFLVAGPFRAAWYRVDAGSASVPGPWRAYLPLVLSLIVTLATLVLISQIAHPFTRTLATVDFAPRGERELFNNQVLGIVSVMLQTGLLMGTLLLAIRRWGQRLPAGTMTLLLVVTGVAILVMDDEYRFVPALLVAGGVAEVLFRWLRPSATRIASARIYAAAVPAVLYGLYFVTLGLTDQIWWRVHTLSGAIAAAAATGLLLSVLAVPAASPGGATYPSE
jgi:hypothetical protein